MMDCTREQKRRPKDAVTNWEQGEMPLAALLQLLQAIGRSREVWGADVCSEPSLHPLDVLRPASREDIRKNARANILIARTLGQKQQLKAGIMKNGHLTCKISKCKGILIKL